MDVTDLQKAHEEFLAVAEGGGFGPPAPGEWDAERLLAHVAATDATIASIALGIVAGQRPTYDNRASLDEWNLRRIVTEAGGLDGLIGLVRAQGQIFSAIAASLPEAAEPAPVHVIIISGTDLAVDEEWSLAQLIGSIAGYHLPEHAEQLAALRPGA